MAYQAIVRPTSASTSRACCAACDSAHSSSRKPARFARCRHTRQIRVPQGLRRHSRPPRAEQTSMALNDTVAR